ncbi:MAG TPA: hypothetical protein VD927_05595, partial [Chryseosolibacter sp.]|nr:hypothetical protein [Chryseosolibacter sp.]
HSLGSQVAYDAMNRINLVVNQGEIATYNADATCSVSSHAGITLAQQLKGFFTFGSPLDKIVFFLRENVPDSAYVRQQMVANFHGFKQRDFDLVSETKEASKYYVEVENTLKRHLDEIQWRNYFDNRDYVSGGLDYFHKVVNVDCKFGSGLFTHSHYWESPAFYDDFYFHFMVNVKRTVTPAEVEEELRRMQG